MASGWTRQLLQLAAVLTLKTTCTAASIEPLVTSSGSVYPNPNITLTVAVTNSTSPGKLKIALWGTRSGNNRNSTVLANRTYAFGPDGIDAKRLFYVLDLIPGDFYNLYLDVTGQFGNNQTHTGWRVQLDYVNNINVVVLPGKIMYLPAGSVLPKFSVTVAPQPDDDVTNPVLFSGLRKSSDGKDVKSTVQIYISAYNYHQPILQKSFILRVAEINGSYRYVFNVSLVNTANSTHPTFSSVNVTANVVKDATGVSQATTLKIPVWLTLEQRYNSNRQNTITDNSLKLSFLYKEQELVDTERTDEQEQMRMIEEPKTFNTRSRQAENKLACKNYISNADGFVAFSLPLSCFKIHDILQEIAVHFPTIVNDIEPPTESPRRGG